MSHAAQSIPWARLAELLARDPGRRGLTAITSSSERQATALRDAALSLFGGEKVGIVTGFCVADAAQPTGETDGPPGSLYLARALAEMGIEPLLISDLFSIPLLEAGCDVLGLSREWIVPMPFDPLGSRERNADHLGGATDAWIQEFLAGRAKGMTHLIAIERCGPSHTSESLAAQGADAATITAFEKEVPLEHRNACHNMRGIDVTPFTAKTHRLFEQCAPRGDVISIGIGDGGNELGMGSIPWQELRSAIPGGSAAQIACRIPADHLLVCGVSNWGGYALALAVAALGARLDRLRHADVECERSLIEHMVRETNAVDGTTRLRQATVDGLPLETYLQILGGLRRVFELPP